MTDPSILLSASTGYFDDLYDQFLEDPENVSSEWQEYFRDIERTTPQVSSGPSTSATLHSAAAEKQASVAQLISAMRYRAHREADLDPLGLADRTPVPDLRPDHYGLTEADMDETFNTGSLFGPDEMKLRDIVSLLDDTYRGTIGTELTHVGSTEQKRWVQERLESVRGRPSFDAEKKRDILRWITSARKLEEYLHRKYVGQKRFSLEGGESLIPLLDEIVQRAGKRSVREMVIGMAHRGRLNVLVNVFGKHPKVLFGEFEGKIDVGSANGSGDVKYHLGFSSNVETPGGATHIALAFNPSHLEIINPVVEGSVRARQTRRKDRARNEVLPVLIHGDAAFAGQGVVTETLNLAETRGFSTGGTLHVIVNNQIGFTTSDPLDSRSTLYCTDVAKLVQAPIFHVNGDDPEAVIFITQLAHDFRMEFHKDVVIDLVCYRRHGHNEADEPMVTQPMMYRKIREQKGVRRLYAERLEAEGVIAPGEADQMTQAYLEALEKNEVVSRPVVEGTVDFVVDWAPYRNQHWRAPAQTSIPLEAVERLGMRLTEYPENFELHRVVKRLITARREMASGERPMDWGFAESLAFSSLLEAGFPVRLSGQDSERGTFAHRHATLHNQARHGTYQPMANLFEGQPRFDVINSLLSEEAVLGFEYGFSTAEPETLVIWEAQFGDFVNGAQVVIDQFLSSSESKWERLCGLTLLLPHGYEGAGPEHSSARLERFLQLCAEDNIQVCVPSTPAQIFHLLRRQAIRPVRKPLVIMSPKSLLRHRLAVSTREDLTGSGYQLLIDDIDGADPTKVTRLVLCSGKVFYDLLEKRREQQLEHIAIVRVEQTYPFPEDEIRESLARYSNAKDIVWAQEEPRNQGTWFFMLSRRHLAGCIDPSKHRLTYAGREYSASPAAGYLNVHIEQQRALVSSALGLDEIEAQKQRSA
jgi:2-oxoglutarate dehydrogenase E1 component